VMERNSQFSKILRSRYLFHVHTKYTDGRGSVQQYIETARRLGYDAIIFLEHIRRQPSYNVQQFVNEIHSFSQTLQFPALVGFEAKLLPSGQLDISPKHVEMSDVVGLAVHQFPSDISQYVLAFSKALRSLEGPAKVWVHPGLWLYRRHLLKEKFLVYRKMIQIAIQEGWFIEENQKYHLISRTFRGLVPRNRLIVGLDAHSPSYLF